MEAGHDQMQPICLVAQTLGWLSKPQVPACFNVVARRDDSSIFSGVGSCHGRSTAMSIRERWSIRDQIDLMANIECCCICSCIQSWLGQLDMNTPYMYYVVIPNFITIKSTSKKYPTSPNRTSLIQIPHNLDLTSHLPWLARVARGTIPWRGVRSDSPCARWCEHHQTPVPLTSTSHRPRSCRNMSPPVRPQLYLAGSLWNIFLLLLKMPEGCIVPARHWTFLKIEISGFSHPILLGAHQMQPTSAAALSQCCNGDVQM